MNRHVITILIILFWALFSRPAGAQVQRIPFQGNLNLLNQSLSIQWPVNQDSSVLLQAQKISDNSFHVKVNFNHLDTPLFNFSSEIDSAVDVFRNQDDSFKQASGKLFSQYSLIDYKPVGELQGRFDIKDRRLTLDSIVFGNVAVNGYVDLFYPFNLDLTVGMSDIAMDDFLNCFYRLRTFESEGLVSGEIKVSGSLNRLAIKTNLIGEDGLVKTLDFEKLYVNGEGTYPYLELAQSVLVKAGGFSLSVKGPLDLTDFKNFGKQIKALTLSPIVSDSGEERQWTIKSYDEEGSRMKTELKYLLRDKTSDPEGKEKSGMLGIQKTMEF